MRRDLWHRVAVRRGACVRALAFLAVVALSSTSGVPAADATGGTQLWVARYDVAQPAANDVAALGVSPDGAHVFVTGTISHADGANYRTVAYDASTGGEVWTKGYGPDGSNGRATALGVSPGGSTVFVTGWSYRTAVGGADYVTIAYDAASGTRLWTRHSPFLIGNGPDHPAMLGVSPDGSTVFLSGTSDAGPALFDYATVAYEAATGRRLWTARFDGGSRDSARALGVSPDGSAVFVTGYSVGSKTSLDFATIGYDATTGERLWKARYDGHRSLEDQGNALSVSPDGSRVFVAGFSEGSNRARDFATIAYSASTGAQRWVRRYNGPRDSNDNVKAMGVSPDGSRVFVTGYRSGHLARDIETIAYDASTGARLWLRSYDRGVENEDQATALGVSPDSRSVFVTGFSYNGTFLYEDYVTLAYRAATGTRRWLQIYDGGDYEAATALGVRPDGSSVFVSGVSDYDFATVAYSTS